METRELDSLKGNKKNPRTISKHDFEALKKSIKEFGDLSGVVFNRTTGQLAGGHQRIEAFKRLEGQKRVVITHEYPEPNRQGTVAIGYVDYDNEQYAYREVVWSPERETAANIAANRIQGEFDLDLLGELTHELSKLEDKSLLDLTGQTEDEVDKLLKMSGAINEPDPEPDINDDNDKLEFALTAEQREIIEEALGHIKATQNLQAVQTKTMNGAALFLMARQYLDNLHARMEQKDAAQPTEPTTQP